MSSLSGCPIYGIGLNHKITAIDIREKFYLSKVEKELLLSNLRSHPSVAGAFILSTCNRTEIYAHLLTNEPEIILNALFAVKKVLQTQNILKNFYCHRGELAVRHLFSVAAGLDSLVLGEKQILGQVKEAADLAREREMMSRDLNILIHLAIRAGKKAQTETEIGSGGSSVSWAAVAMAQERLQTLQGREILVIGAGKMGYLAAEQLKNKNVGTIYVMNRNCDKAEAVAETIDGVPTSFWQMKEVLQKVDVCICSAGAPHYLVEKELIEEVMSLRDQRPLVCVDISMPRNIDPQVASVSGVQLLTIDELDKVVGASVQRRQNAVGAVESIVLQKVNEYFEKMLKANAVKQEMAENIF